MNMTAPYEPPFRSRKVLDHAQGQPCTLRFKVCNRNPETVVSCHIRDRHKGMGTKASDSSIAFGCSECHAYLDEGKWLGDMDEASMLRIVVRAMQETWEILIRDGIVGFPHNRRVTHHEKMTPPRKPKDLRTKVPVGKPLQSGSTFPKGRKLESKNDMRRKMWPDSTD